MEHARPPPELRVEGSPTARADAWRKWWMQFSVFIKASGIEKQNKDVQASLLVNLIGAEGYEIFTTFTYSKEESAEDLTCLKKKFDAHFGTKTNVTMSRFKFFCRNQQSGETINQYVTALKLLSQNCEFEHLVDGLLRDRIVCGVSNNVVRDRMLRTEKLSLAKAVQICEADEMSKEEGRQIEEASPSNVQMDALDGRYPGRGAGERWRGGRSARRRGGRGAGGTSTAQRRAPRESCARCGSAFCDDSSRCPAGNAMCFVCNNRGHFARVCPFKVVSKRVHEMNIAEVTTDDSGDEDTLYVNMLDSGNKNSNREWIQSMNINEAY